MTAVQFNNQPIKLCDFPKINLDNIDERCGEVYITLNGTLVFHCALCSNNYGSIDNFLDHLSTHYKDVQEEKDVAETDNDAKTDGIDSEAQLEHYNTYELRQEQKLVNDDVDISDDGIHDHEEYEVMLQNKEAVSLDWVNFEHIVAESKESNSEQIEDELEIEEHTLRIQSLEGNHTRTKARCRYQTKVDEFICKECGRKCRTNLSLKRHFAIHSDERRYKCKFCDFAFKDRANCVAHVRRRHLGTNKIECEYCPKTFFTQYEVRSHRRTHTGERYSCSICDKTYTTSNRLKIHNKCHTSEPSFKCNYCEKAFYERSNYEDHMLSHTKEKQFVCEICAATFSRHKSWRKHSKLHEKLTQ